MICRLGGDEFAAVLPACDETEAEAVGQRLLDSLTSPTMSATTASP